MSRLFFYVNNLSSWLVIAKQMDEMEGNGKCPRIIEIYRYTPIYTYIYTHTRTYIHTKLNAYI